MKHSFARCLAQVPKCLNVAHFEMQISGMFVPDMCNFMQQAMAEWTSVTQIECFNYRMVWRQKMLKNSLCKNCMLCKKRVKWPSFGPFANFVHGRLPSLCCAKSLPSAHASASNCSASLEVGPILSKNIHGHTWMHLKAEHAAFSWGRRHCEFLVCYDFQIASHRMHFWLNVGKFVLKIQAVFWLLSGQSTVVFFRS